MNVKHLSLPNIVGFDWDKGNLDKNRLKHGVIKEECEEVFFNKPIVIFDDPGHSTDEMRYKVLGITDKGRLIALVFTMRVTKIRVISARDQSKRERHYYKNPLL